MFCMQLGETFQIVSAKVLECLAIKVSLNRGMCSLNDWLNGR